MYLNLYFITDDGGSAQGVESDRKNLGNTTHTEILGGMRSNDN